MFAPEVLHCEPTGGATHEATPLALELSRRPAAAPLPVSWRPVNRPVPETSSFVPGAAVPMPTLPLPLIRMTSLNAVLLPWPKAKSDAAESV
jgi:hypothetical protein